MASKYDIYWLSIIEDIRDGIFEAMDKNKIVNIDVQNIAEYGKRNSWCGIVEVSPDGIRRGEMAHAMSLGKIVMEQGFFKDIDDIRIKFKISNSLELEIEVVSEKLIKREMEEIKKASTFDKHSSFDKTIISPKLLIETIYFLLRKLPTFNHSYDVKNLPQNGIYFFYEDGEKCEINGVVTDRIVRIGKNQSENRFRDRIRNHYRGNKNSSVFRTHVGSAIINRDKLVNINMNEWMKHMTPTNYDIEELINGTFKEKFRFRCISVQSKDQRSYLEERLIATLSRWNYQPSNRWLGHFAEKREIRRSGLWNVQYTRSKNIMREEDLSFLEDKVNSSTLLDQYSVGVDIDKELGKKQNEIICFIPCCKNKYPSGNIIKPERKLSVKDLPNMWDNLSEGREGMQYCLEHTSPKTSALNLYNGHFYNPLFSCRNEIIKLIKSSRLRLIVISAGYGIVDALEPIRDYDEEMKGKVASHWRQVHLTSVIADLLLQEKPKHVFGFFAGESYWSTPGSKYRYFFTEGVKTALRKGLDAKSNGCFYRKEGRGSGAILGSLGRTFIELLRLDFNDSYVDNVYKNDRRDGNIKIGFNRI